MASGGSTGRPKLIEAGGDSRFPPLAGLPARAHRRAMSTCSRCRCQHNTGFTTFAVGLVQGHHLVLMPRFEPPSSCASSPSTGSPSWLRCRRSCSGCCRCTGPTRTHTTCRRSAGSGISAAPCPPAIKQAWIELLGPEVVWELYGGTELQALTFISGDQWLTHPGSVGVVVAGEMKVLDDDGNECPPGVSGEIYMRPSPGSAPTYRYIGSTAKTRDGWDSLGDLGYFDADGFLYLYDRRVDMFTVGGRNVYPAEIESALCAHPDVLSCLVVGVPDEDLGQVPYALVQADGTRRGGA